jgi:hypothetical protein
LKRRNHTVPRFYLSRFANEVHQLRRIPLVEPENSHLISVRDATVIKDFYLVQDEDGTFDDRVEDLLSKIEGEGANGFKDLFDQGEWPITLETREKVAQWIALQFLRGPAQRQMLNEISDAIFKLDVAIQGRDGMRRALEHNSEAKATDEEVDSALLDFSDTGSYHLKTHPNAHIKSILSNLEKITQSLFIRAWTIIKFERKTLLFSDHPVALIPAIDHPQFMGVGILNAQGILVPVGRQMALFMDWPPREVDDGVIGTGDHRIAGTTDIANWINGAVMNTARKALFTHPDDSHLTSGSLPEPRSREVGIPDFEPFRRISETDG